jgi:hypothetical protein
MLPRDSEPFDGGGVGMYNAAGGRGAGRFMVLALVLVWTATMLGAASAAAPSYTDWSAPVNLGSTVNAASSDTNAALSADGLSLFFDSDRAGGFGGRDLWVSQRATPSAAWGTPVDLGAVVNSSFDDANAALSTDGHWLFFSSPRPGGFGGSDLYQSYRADVNDDFDWEAPTSLGPNVNTAGTENGTGGYFENGGNPQLYFGSIRPGGIGGSDIYMSDLQPDGTWGPATLVTELSSTSQDNRPNLRPDGLEIFFYSNRPGGPGGNDLWTATRASTDAPWSTPVSLSATVNTTASEAHPSLSADGRTLVFDSDRAGGSGGNDLWVTTREARLTVTAEDQSRLFGQPNPPLTASITGFVGGENASLVSGTAACSTTATAASPAGDYPITCTLGSLSAPGYVFDTFVAGTLTVAYSRPCLTGLGIGPLRVASGQAVCLGATSVQIGPVTVAPGGSLDVEGGSIAGPVTTTGAGVVRICGARIAGPLTISGGTGPVLIGGAGCDPNTVVGPVRITDNAGGVEIGGNRVLGPLRVTGNSAPVEASGNAVIGPVTIQP